MMVESSWIFIIKEASPLTQTTQIVRMGDLHSYSGWHAVTHGAEATGRHPAIRLVESQILCRPHLVLADISSEIDRLVLVNSYSRDKAYCGLIALYHPVLKLKLFCARQSSIFSTSYLLPAYRAWVFRFPFLDHLPR